VPTVSSAVKVESIRACDADVVVTGDRYADALGRQRAARGGIARLPIHAFDQLETLLGQGTVARELSEQVPMPRRSWSPVGGGGLIGGIASWYAGSDTRGSAWSRAPRPRSARRSRRAARWTPRRAASPRIRWRPARVGD
jgi:threonine dehydratase